MREHNRPDKAVWNNLINALDNLTRTVKRFPTERLNPQGTYKFTLYNPDTGEVHQRVSENTIVDEGKNELLRYIGDITQASTFTFSGDGSTTRFSIPEQYVLVTEFNSVSVGGTTQSFPGDYQYDLSTKEIVFSSAPASGTDNISVGVDFFVHPFRWLAVGTDGTAVSSGDTSLGSEVARIDLMSSLYSIDTASNEITGEWEFSKSQANVSIAEAGLFDVPANPSVAGDMLSRATISPTIDKNDSFALNGKWTLSM
jgi:hypothetical protein